jgi:hypothetical protein
MRGHPHGTGPIAEHRTALSASRSMTTRSSAAAAWSRGSAAISASASTVATVAGDAPSVSTGQPIRGIRFVHLQ